MEKKISFIILFLSLFTISVFALGGYAPEYTGYSVSINENVAAVGSTSHDRFGGFLQILEFKNSKWKMIQTINLGKETSGYRVPVSMDMDQNCIVMGADVLRGKPGAIVVYKKNNQAEWKKMFERNSSDKKADDLYGFSVAMDGEELIIGAKDYNESKELYATGKVYINGLFSLNEKQVLQPFEINPSRLFGNSIAIQKNILVIGSVGLNHEKATKSSPYSSYGGVYVYEKQGERWYEKARLHELPFFNDQKFPEFGEYLCFNGVTIFTTSYSKILLFEQNDDWDFVEILSDPVLIYDKYQQCRHIHCIVSSNDIFAYSALMDLKDNPNQYEDVVFIYRKVNRNWMLTDCIKSSDLLNDKSEYFGYSLDLFEDKIIIGAIGDDPAAPTDKKDNPFPGKAHIVKIFPDQGFRLEATIGFHEEKNSFGISKRVSYVENY